MRKTVFVWKGTAGEWRIDKESKRREWQGMAVDFVGLVWMVGAWGLVAVVF
jgi:hypothetical protein